MATQPTENSPSEPVEKEQSPQSNVEEKPNDEKNEQEEQSSQPSAVEKTNDEKREQDEQPPQPSAEQKVNDANREQEEQSPKPSADEKANDEKHEQKEQSPKPSAEKENDEKHEQEEQSPEPSVEEKANDEKKKKEPDLWKRISDELSLDGAAVITVGDLKPVLKKLSEEVEDGEDKNNAKGKNSANALKCVLEKLNNYKAAFEVENNPPGKPRKKNWYSVLAQSLDRVRKNKELLFSKVDKNLNAIKPCDINPTPEIVEKIAGQLVNIMNGIVKGRNPTDVVDFAKIVIVLCRHRAVQELKEDALTKWGKHFARVLLLHFDSRKQLVYYWICAALQVLHEKKLISCSMFVPYIEDFVFDMKNKASRLAMVQYVTMHLKESDVKNENKFFMDFFFSIYFGKKKTKTSKNDTSSAVGKKASQQEEEKNKIEPLPVTMAPSGEMIDEALYGIIWVMVYGESSICKTCEQLINDEEKFIVFEKIRCIIADELKEEKKRKQEEAKAKEEEEAESGGVVTKELHAFSPKTGTAASESTEPDASEHAPYKSDTPERTRRLAADRNTKHQGVSATAASARRGNYNRLQTPVSRFSARNQTASNVTEESNKSRSQGTPRRQGRLVYMRVPSTMGGIIPQSGRRRTQSVAISQPIFDDGELSEEDDMILISNENRRNRLDRYIYLRRTANEKANKERTAPVIYFEDYDVLKEDLESCVSPALLEMLTARSDHFSQYEEAIKMIKPVMSRNPEITVQVSDVLLRWAAYRIEQKRTPPSCLTAFASFVNKLCEVLIASDLKLSDYEASALIPAICGKLDNNKEDVQQKLRSCILYIQDVVPHDIMLVYLSLSLKRNLGRNGREKVQQQVCTLIDAECSSKAGLPVGVLSKIAEVSYGDNEATGLAAAACMSRAHHHFGDELWEILGTLTDDQARKMEERLVAASAGQENDIATPSRFATPTTQGIDIRPSDYRLSVAPEPAPSIRSALDSVLTKKTPAKTRPAFGRSRAVYSSGARPTEESMESGKGDIKAYVLLKLNSSSWEELEEGLSELYKNLQLEEKSVLRNSPSEIVPRLSHCFSNALEQIEEMKGDGDMLILKRLLNAIMAYAREPKAIVQLTQEALESVLNDLFYAMVPEDVGGNTEWKQIRRGVNLVLLKVLESCPKNLLYTSLIHVLGSSIRQLANTRTEAVRLRLNAKCSFCINSIAKTAQNGFGHCDVSALLLVMNEFLIEYPIEPEDAKPSKQQAMTFRLLRTLVDRLVEDMGISIRKHLPTPSDGNDSQLSRYVEMVLTSSDPACYRSIRFDGAPSSHPSETLGGGSGQVYFRKLKEIQRDYQIDTTSRTSRDHPNSYVIDSNIVEAKDDNKSRMCPTASGAMKEAKAEFICRIVALREWMARVRSGEV